MENHTFLVFLFAISVGILFVGNGITGLYSLDVDEVESCDNGNDCSSGKVCCAFKEGGYISRVCAKSCKDSPYEKGIDSFVFDVTGRGTQNVGTNTNPWIYILIGIILVLLALFYKKSPEKIIVRKKVKKKKKR